MKKLLKFMGLLLVAGALFVGCQQNVDIDTDEVTLSNGDWKMTQTSSFSFTDEDGDKNSISSGLSASIEVANKIFTFTAVTQNTSISITLESESAAQYLKSIWEANLEPDEKISVSGKTVTIKSSYTLSDAEIAESFGGRYNAEHVEKGFQGAKIKTNKKRTEYKLTYKDKRSYGGKSYDADVVITFKKK